MKALAITSKGIEETTTKEINGIIKTKTEQKNSCVVFEPKELIDLCTLCYKAQSITQVLTLFDSFNFKTNDEFFSSIKNIVDKINLDEWLDKDKTFRVSCSKVDNDSISSEEINTEIGGFIIDKIKKSKKYEQKVNLDNPDVIFYVFISNNDCFFGIDFAGIDLSKRDYKVFSHPAALKGTVAYALLRIADYKKGEILLDPFTGSGTIPIEAALSSSNISPNYFRKDRFAFLKLKCFSDIDFDDFFDKIDRLKKIEKKPMINAFDAQFRYVDASKKNAKIAGVDKIINFSRMEIEWLDTKMDKNCIDKIVTNPPAISKHTNPKDIEKLYNEFFYQADFILKKKGKIVTIARSPEELKKAAEKHKFKLKEEKPIWLGKQESKVIVFTK
ncbi:methyltransferase [Candidatus Woesearchaeota archaeon]|nr:methyltransferase [Candidatus Woesearchaeota archaeon]